MKGCFSSSTDSRFGSSPTTLPRVARQSAGEVGPLPKPKILANHPEDIRLSSVEAPVEGPFLLPHEARQSAGEVGPFNPKTADSPDPP